MQKPELGSFLVGFVILGGGCSVNLSVPSDTVVSCKTNDDCDEGICAEALGYCVEAGGDQTPPGLTGDVFVTQDVLGPGATTNIIFAVDEDLGIPPSVQLVWGGQDGVRDCDVVEQDGLEYTFSYTADANGGDPDVVANLVIGLVDTSGNPGRVELPRRVAIDSSPPGLISETVSLRLVPSDDNLLRQVEAAGPGTTATLFFALDELADPAAPPVVRLLEDPSIVFDLGTSEGTFYIFELLVDDSLVDGTYTLEVDVGDAGGNRAVVPVPGASLVIDVTPPAPPIGTGLFYRRFPWGGEETGLAVRFELQGEEGAVESASTVVVYDSPNSVSASEVGRIVAASDGSFGLTQGFALNPLDRPDVYAVAVDNAGNPSASVAAQNGSWTASLGGAQPEQNPHSARSGTGTESPSPLGRDLLEIFSQQRDLLIAVDSSSWTVNAESFWIDRALENPGAISLGTMAHLPAGGRTFLFGGLGGDIFAEGVWEWDGTNWAVLAPAGPKPADRAGAAMAYDWRRDRLVMYGGTNNPSDPFTDTWEWDGNRWQELTASSPTNPGSRLGSAATYDATTGEVLVFGGMSLALGGECFDGSAPIGGLFCVLSDLWAWDGAEWTERCSGATCGVETPAGRVFATLTYDPIRQESLLVGGCIPNGDGTCDATTIPTNDQAWVLDQTGWARTGTLGTTPAARYGQAVVFDPTTAELLLVGGCSYGALFDGCTHVPDMDIWSWDGLGWSTRSTQVGPSARGGHYLAYDGTRGEMVLYGGVYNISDSAYDPGGFHNDQCGDGTTLLIGPDECEPNDTGDVVQDCRCYYQDTWVWRPDGDQWELRAGTSQVPDGRRDGRMVFVESERISLLFGGSDSDDDDCDDSGEPECGLTWFWDGAQWSANQGPEPHPRSVHHVGYDPLADEVILFGGDSQDCVGLCDDTWMWSVLAGWVELSPAVMPTGRTEGALVWDGTGLLLFGGCAERANAQGQDCVTPLNDTWRWSGTNWVQLFPSTQPPVRSGHSVSFDSARGRVVLNGGEYCVSDCIPAGDPEMAGRPDTWEWTGTDWVEVFPATTPEPRAQATMIFDSTRARTLMFAGTKSIAQGGGGVSELWEWDGLDWVELNPAGTLPPPRRRHSMVFDDSRRISTLFSGSNDDKDTWLLDTSPEQHPFIVFDFDWSKALVSDSVTQSMTVVIEGTGTGYGTDLAGNAAGDFVGAAVMGVDVGLWDGIEARWVSLEQEEDACTTSATRITCVVSNPDRFVFPGNDHILFLLRTEGGTGNGDGTANLTVDYVELRVDYERPAP